MNHTDDVDGDHAPVSTGVAGLGGLDAGYGSGLDAGLGRFLTLADTAELLNISASQAYALVRSGELPAIKVGGHGHWRVERSVLEGYIAAKYEEARRLSLWNQSEYASLDDHPFGDQSRTSRT